MEGLILGVDHPLAHLEDRQKAVIGTTIPVRSGSVLHLVVFGSGLGWE